MSGYLLILKYGDSVVSKAGYAPWTSWLAQTDKYGQSGELFASPEFDPGDRFEIYGVKSLLICHSVILAFVYILL